MKILLTFILLTLANLGFPQEQFKTSATLPKEEENSTPQKQEEEGPEKNTFSIGPYKNNVYEYFGEKERKAKEKAQEASQQD